MTGHLGAGLCTLALVVAGCSDDAAQRPADEPYAFDLPAGFVEPSVPEDNPMSEAKVALGRALFFDVRLSANGTTSCGSCHDPAIGFADARALPVGSTGDVVPRNGPSLTNVAYFGTLTWFNPTLDTLEKQALVPMFGENPVELGITGHEEEVLARFRHDEATAELFREAFPGVDEPVSFDAIVKAIASYERTLIVGDSPYDRWIQGDQEALSAAELRGMDLFFSERLECYHCHAGQNLTTSYRNASSTLAELEFHNTGLYNLDAAGAYPPESPGLYEFTLDPADHGKMRVPSLRNVAASAPYMHDGSIATLEEVIDVYAAGGRNIASGALRGDGRINPAKSSLVREFPITDAERADVVAFLEALTDLELDPTLAE